MSPITLDPVTLSARGSSRMNFSMLHLLSAARFSQAVASSEREHEHSPFGEFFEGILAGASACLMLSVAALEAFANELLMDSDTYLPRVEKAVLDQLWEEYERRPALTKLDLALLLGGHAKVDRGIAPGQEVVGVIALRNALVHFKAEWPEEAREHRSLSSRLQGRFALSPFLPDSEDVFPRRWASHGCTAWAVNSVAQLVNAVELSFGVPSRAAKHGLIPATP